MLISRYFVEFIIFSLLGWLWETFYCTIKNKRWEKRGFLFGPICPIYGVGCIFCFAFMDAISAFNLPTLNWWQILLIVFFGSAALEYSTSVILEKLFHALWWDYSEHPLNLNGRVCLSASCGFAIAGLLVVYVMYPLFNHFFAFISPVIFEVLALAMYTLITIDLTLTVSSLTEVQKKVSMFENRLNENLTDITEDLYSNISKMSRHALLKIKKIKYTKPTQVIIFNKLKDNVRDKKAR